MKFSDRTAPERTAIDAWIRLIVKTREGAYMPVGDNFRAERRESICKEPGSIAQMMRHYATYRHARNPVSFSEYFQVSNPKAYADLLATETAV